MGYEGLYMSFFEGIYFLIHFTWSNNSYDQIQYTTPVFNQHLVQATPQIVPLQLKVGGVLIAMDHWSQTGWWKSLSRQFGGFLRMCIPMLVWLQFDVLLSNGLPLKFKAHAEALAIGSVHCGAAIEMTCVAHVSAAAFGLQKGFGKLLSKLGMGDSQSLCE